MPLKLGNYYFDGPHEKAADLDDTPGILAVISNFHGRRALAEIRETPDIRKEASTVAQEHEQKPDEKPTDDDAVLFAAIYMRNQPDVERKRIVKEFNDQFELPAQLEEVDHAGD